MKLTPTEFDILAQCGISTEESQPNTLDKANKALRAGNRLSRQFFRATEELTEPKNSALN